MSAESITSSGQIPNRFTLTHKSPTLSSKVTIKKQDCVDYNVESSSRSHLVNPDLARGRWRVLSLWCSIFISPTKNPYIYIYLRECCLPRASFLRSRSVKTEARNWILKIGKFYARARKISCTPEDKRRGKINPNRSPWKLKAQRYSNSSSSSLWLMQSKLGRTSKD